MKRGSHPYLVIGAIGVWLCAIATTAEAAQQLASVEANRASDDQQPCVVVRGQVLTVKPIELRRPLRLMEALFLGGGIIEGAGDVVRVVHSSPEIKCAPVPASDWKPDETLAQSYSLAALQRDEETANPVLLPGDIVDVERLPSVVISGCVFKEGAIYIRKPVTVTVAVAMAGGPTSKAHKFTILRHNPASPSSPTLVMGDLELIRKKKAEDLVLKNGDEVEVFRKGKTCGIQFRIFP